MPADIKSILDAAVARYQTPEFLREDPICVPHRFSQKQDIEIAAFFAAVLAWGRRRTIIDKANELMQLMDNAPHQFIVQHQEADRRRLLRFKHRTFTATDTLYFVEFLQRWYSRHDSLEEAFAGHLAPEDPHTGPALAGFHTLFFSLPDYPQRTRKHIASPLTNSACKRLNMFLRWMSRPSDAGVDFGLWQRIRPAQLLIPLDVHVERVANALGLLSERRSGWSAVLELTAKLRTFDPEDPVKYDFALFGMGVLQHKNPGASGVV